MLVRTRVGRMFSGEVRIWVGEVVRIDDQLVGSFWEDGTSLEGLVERSLSRTSLGVWLLFVAFFLGLPTSSGEDDELQKLGHRMTRLSLTRWFVERSSGTRTNLIFMFTERNAGAGRLDE